VNWGTKVFKRYERFLEDLEKKNIQIVRK